METDIQHYHGGNSLQSPGRKYMLDGSTFQSVMAVRRTYVKPPLITQDRLQLENIKLA